MWITQQGYHIDGDLHGSVEKFTGIGIIFDTFKNTETLNAHRDVTILVNDGEKTWEMMTADVKGCNANFRYHNDRADFSVTDSARAKIIIEKNKYDLHISIYSYVNAHSYPFLLCLQANSSYRSKELQRLE
jgi:hypothetical protein